MAWLPMRPPTSLAARLSSAERRRALATLLDTWRDLARDIALVQAGAARSVRDSVLAEEVEIGGPRPAAPGRQPGARAPGGRRRCCSSSNVSPDLLLDVLLLRWPRRATAA